MDHANRPKEYLTKNIVIPFAIIALTNIISAFHIVPVSLQLLLNSTCCVYTGCVLGSKLSRKSSG